MNAKITYNDLTKKDSSKQLGLSNQRSRDFTSLAIKRRHNFSPLYNTTDESGIGKGIRNLSLNEKSRIRGGSMNTSFSETSQLQDEIHKITKDVLKIVNSAEAFNRKHTPLRTKVQMPAIEEAQESEIFGSFYLNGSVEDSDENMKKKNINYKQNNLKMGKQGLGYNMGGIKNKNKHDRMKTQTMQHMVNINQVYDHYNSTISMKHNPFNVAPIN